jgi:hypothetical protein
MEVLLFLFLFVRNRDKNKISAPHATKLTILFMAFEGMELKEQNILKGAQLWDKAMQIVTIFTESNKRGKNSKHKSTVVIENEKSKYFYFYYPIYLHSVLLN